MHAAFGLEFGDKNDGRLTACNVLFIDRRKIIGR
jgi:hypothetical protein